MIRALQFLSDPFLDTEAEDRWDNRFKPVEVSCTCNRGWVEDDTGWYRCLAPGCDLGEVIVELCVKCSQPESMCFCSVGDFMEER